MQSVKFFPTGSHVRIRPNDAKPIDIHVKTYGEPKNPAILVVNGIGANMETVPEKSFYEKIAAEDLFVVAFSNRDAGGSTKMEHLHTRSMVSTLALGALAGLLPPTTTLALLLACVRYRHHPSARKIAVAALALMFGFKASGGTKAFHMTPAYTLDDVAEDIVLLMKEMNIAQAHIMGVSMGGMLAQTAVVNYPERFLSLASVMSDTGGISALGLPDYPLSTLFYLYVTHPMSRPDLSDHDGTIKYESETIEFNLTRAKSATWNNGLTLMEEAERRHDAHMLHDTMESRKNSMARQMDSIAWQRGDRSNKLNQINIPTVVVHGMDDKLIPVESGMETAKAIGYPACRRVVLVPESGHTMDDGFVEHCVDAIVENCRHAEGRHRSKL